VVLLLWTALLVGYHHHWHLSASGLRYRFGVLHVDIQEQMDQRCHCPSHALLCDSVTHG